MRRRSFLRSAGVAGAGPAGLGSLGTAAATHRDYRYHGTFPAPSVEEIVTQDGWAFCTSSGGILTVDMSDPTAPSFGDRVQGDDITSTHDVKVDTYETDDCGEMRIAVLTHTRIHDFRGISVFDVTDPTDIQHLTTTETAGTVHNCFFKDGYAYLTIHAGAPARMVIYDLGDPWNPTTLEGEDPSYESYRDVIRPDHDDSPPVHRSPGLFVDVLAKVAELSENLVVLNPSLCRSTRSLIPSAGDVERDRSMLCVAFVVRDERLLCLEAVSARDALASVFAVAHVLNFECIVVFCHPYRYIKAGGYKNPSYKTTIRKRPA